MHEPAPQHNSVPQEQRGWPRLSPVARPTVRLFVAPHYRPATALLHDLSAGGAGLLARQEVAEGAVLLVQLGNGRGGTRTQLARAVRRRRLGAGAWLVGCQWLCLLGGVVL